MNLAANFFHQYKRPFGLNNLMCLCMISQEEAEAAITEGLQSGQLIEPEPGIYSVRRLDELNHCVARGGTNWRYNAEVALQIIAQIRKHPSHGTRKIGDKLGVSRTFVQKYLEALASIGAIQALCTGYRLIRDDNIHEIGTRIEKGIISRQRAAARKGGIDASSRNA